MNTRRPHRTAIFLLAAAALAGSIAIQSAPAPLLTLDWMGESSVLLTWTNDGPGFVVQTSKPLQAPGLWQTLPQTPQLLGGRLRVTVPIQTNESQFFRLRAKGVEFTNHQEVLCWQIGGTFDASTLLSADSIQNPFQLSWTISSNAVGATVSPGGVVGLGTGVGSFTVAASATNGAGQDSFTLNTIRLGFTNTSSVLGWQSNGTMSARALLSASSSTNDSMLTWMIGGTGPATIDGTGMVAFGTSGGSYTVQVAARSNAACSAALALGIIRLEFGTSQTVTCWQSNGLFSAKALLTTNSTTDDSLLQWTISGSPPASIDGAGTVTLGSGAGNYAVRVAARSNAAWAATLSLGVTNVHFAKSQATIGWQSGATFNARALLATNGITNAASLNWSISGSPAATINTSGVVTLGSGGGSYSIQAIAKGALPCSDVLTLNAMEVHLLSISFVGAGAANGGNNQHVLYENAAPQGWGDGAAITNPVWIAPVSGTNGPPVRNAPVCYTCSGAAGSKARVQAVVNIKPGGQTLNFIALDQSTEYFRSNGILSAGVDQSIDVIASVPLPATIEKLSKTFTWQAVFTDGGSGVTCGAGQSTQTIYTVYAPPITYVESQTNNPTPNRLDFCILGVAKGLSNKVDICDHIAAQVRAMTGDGYGAMLENPRWIFYTNPPPRDVDCSHRAALAASGFGVLGIQGYVHRTYSTCYPVPAAPPYMLPNSTPNDYMGTYNASRLKYRQSGADVQMLRFLGNNFEGCVRVEDGSADDGNAWWTIWPLARHDNAKALLIYYTGINGCPEQWQKLDGTFVGSETVPVTQLANTPKVIGGPD